MHTGTHSLYTYIACIPVHSRCVYAQMYKSMPSTHPSSPAMLKYNSAVTGGIYGRSPVTPWAKACVGREKMGYRDRFWALLCAEPSAGCWGTRKAGVMWFLSWGSLHSRSWFPSLLSHAVGAGSSLGGHVCINWIRDQLVRELRGERFLLSQQRQERYFYLRRSVYSFTVGLVRIN